MPDPVGPKFIPKAVLTAGRVLHQPFEIPTEMTKSALLQGGTIHAAVGSLNQAAADAVAALEPRGPAKLLDRLFGKLDGALVHSAGQAQKATEVFWVPFSNGAHQVGHSVSNPFAMFYANRAGFTLPTDPAELQATLATITAPGEADPDNPSTRFPGFKAWPTPPPPAEEPPAEDPAKTPDGEDGTKVPDDTKKPEGDGTETKPEGDGTTKPEGDGTETKPEGDGTETKPEGDSTEAKPEGDGTEVKADEVAATEEPSTDAAADGSGAVDPAASPNAGGGVTDPAASPNAGSGAVDPAASPNAGGGVTDPAATPNASEVPEGARGAVGPAGHPGGVDPAVLAAAAGVTEAQVQAEAQAQEVAPPQPEPSATADATAGAQATATAEAG